MKARDVHVGMRLRVNKGWLTGATVSVVTAPRARHSFVTVDRGGQLYRIGPSNLEPLQDNLFDPSTQSGKDGAE